MIIILIILMSISSLKLNKIDKIYIYFDGASCITCQPNVVYAFGYLGEIGLESKIVLVNKQKKKKFIDYNLKLIKENNSDFVLRNTTVDTLYINNMDYFKPILIKLSDGKSAIIRRNEVPDSKDSWVAVLEKLTE